MAHKYTLGVDFGGSSSKATLLQDTGKIVATSTIEYPSYFPFPNWYEQNVDELFEAFIYNVRACLEKSRIDPADILAISIDAATHMAVFCDENDRPIRNFIHWSDGRSGKQVRFLKENYSELIGKHSLNTVSPMWNLPQILWLNENEPEVLKKTKRIYFVKDYIRHLVTGDFCTDSIESMGSMLADDHKSQWSPELCGIAGVKARRWSEWRCAAWRKADGCQGARSTGAACCSAGRWCTKGSPDRVRQEKGGFGRNCKAYRRAQGGRWQAYREVQDDADHPFGR